MYQTSYLEDYIEDLYERLGINQPDELDKYAIGNKLNIGIYLVSGESEAFCSNDRNYIFINRNLKHQERWQDFAHELCHVLRHSGHQGRIPPMFRELQERQADNFMYHFCIPTFMLRQLSLPSSMQQAVPLIAETFKVNHEFAEYRLSKYFQKVLCEGVK